MAQIRSGVGENGAGDHIAQEWTLTDSQTDISEMMRAGIERMPYNAMIGIRILELGDGHARGSLPARSEVGNHVGTMHAGAQFSLMEATSGAAAASAFIDLLGSATPLAQGADLTYRKPARGDVVAEAAVTADDMHRVRAELADQGRSRFDVAVRLLDAEGTLATEATVRWFIRMNAQQG
ncbi:MAG TPA: YiiD C-terminal domain-containing protein [Candidatus Dormibacteraeota bacterium]|jgi:uncharacterized protein (TIGR00369 family)|nr:YiiD C-terminal domain-containing protein [Candidatus Dormibacteraeota bacterium]